MVWVLHNVTLNHPKEKVSCSMSHCYSQPQLATVPCAMRENSVKLIQIIIQVHHLKSLHESREGLKGCGLVMKVSTSLFCSQGHEVAANLFPQPGWFIQNDRCPVLQTEFVQMSSSHKKTSSFVYRVGNRARGREKKMFIEWETSSVDFQDNLKKLTTVLATNLIQRCHITVRYIVQF